MEPNFSGFVSKANLKCADGRTIMPGAFAHQDGVQVPLLYQHNHKDISQVLGHAILKDVPGEGTWGDLFFNDSQKAKDADVAIKHGDLKKMSIWAKNLDEVGSRVRGGDIQEVSLVLAGANPGANIENILMHDILAHSDVEEDEIVVWTFDLTELKHSDTAEEPPKEEPKAEEKPAEGGEETQGDVLATLTPEQEAAVNKFIEDLVPELLTQALAEEPVLQHDNIDSSEKGNNMNVFDQTTTAVKDGRPELKHSDVEAVLKAAKGPKGEGGQGAVSSLREFVRASSGGAGELMHADDYGVQNLEILFPEARALMTTPKFIDRRQDWVKAFMGGVGHSPFSRVRTYYADITADEARAKGYIKANQKTDEVFPIFKRETGPAWIYKRQKLDRQDIIDVTSFDIVSWMKVEMRGKLDEELARAAMFGDGRPTMVGGNLNPDKIPDPGADNASGNGIRAIVNDNDLYTTTYSVPLPADPEGADWNILLDTVTEAQEFYLGSGNKTAFMSYRIAVKLLTIRDNFGHRIYRNLSEVAGDMDVANIVRVPTELMPSGVLCIVLDLADYNFGTDRGGELTFFDDFDIDFNQYKYLYEVYLSGALTLPYSAQIFKSVASTDVELTPTKPAIAANVITVPTQTGVVYKRKDTGATLSAGSTLTLNNTTLKSVEIEATPTSGYYFESNADQLDSWKYSYKA